MTVTVLEKHARLRWAVRFSPIVDPQTGAVDGFQGAVVVRLHGRPVGVANEQCTEMLEALQILADGLRPSRAAALTLARELPPAVLEVVVSRVADRFGVRAQDVFVAIGPDLIALCSDQALHADFEAKRARPNRDGARHA